MNSVEKIAKSLKRHGRDVTVDMVSYKKKCRAVVAPLRYKNKMYLEANVTMLGMRDTSRTLYIGPPDIDFTENWTSVTVDDGTFKYSVARADMIYCGNKPAFIWAVLFDRENSVKS